MKSFALDFAELSEEKQLPSGPPSGGMEMAWGDGSWLVGGCFLDVMRVGMAFWFRTIVV